MTQLTVFTGDDQRFLLIVFAASALAALALLAQRGLPSRLTGWLVPVLIAFVPAFLLGAYIAMVTATSPG
jgi:hypothetical protein